MIVSFQLSMPNVGSWNGIWTGAGRPYFIVMSLNKRAMSEKPHFKKLLETGKDSWHYSWNDGWGANVTAEIVTASEANKRRRASVGFCGYDWMVDTIISHGKILNPVEKLAETKVAS